MKTIMLGAIATLAWSASAVLAADLDSLKADGFFVWQTTSIRGDFNGCERGKSVALENGMTFVCSGTGYTHARNPKVTLLKTSRAPDCKMLVNQVVLDGAIAPS
jgi:hypothetical protein